LRAGTTAMTRSEPQISSGSLNRGSIRQRRSKSAKAIQRIATTPAAPAIRRERSHLGARRDERLSILLVETGKLLPPACDVQTQDGFAVEPSFPRCAFVIVAAGHPLLTVIVDALLVVRIRSVADMFG
jgi:hypothetical protein